MTLLGGRMSHDDATPQNMITKKAYAITSQKWRRIMDGKDAYRTIYVDVETACSFPLRILMANAMTDPMNVPSWNIAGFGLVLLTRLAEDQMISHPRIYQTFYPCPSLTDNSS